MTKYPFISEKLNGDMFEEVISTVRKLCEAVSSDLEMEMLEVNLSLHVEVIKFNKLIKLKQFDCLPAHVCSMQLLLRNTSKDWSLYFFFTISLIIGSKSLSNDDKIGGTIKIKYLALRYLISALQNTHCSSYRRRRDLML